MKKLMAMMMLCVPCYAGPTLTILGGGNFPASNIDVGGRSVPAGDPGLAGGAQIMFPVSESVSAGFDYLYNDFGEKSDPAFFQVTPGVPAAGIDYHLHSQVFLAGLRLSPPIGEEKARLFFFGGLGFHRTSATGDATLQPGYFWTDTGTSETRQIVNDSSVNFAAAAGLGIEREITDLVSIGIEGRYQFMKSAKFQTVPVSTVIPLTTTIEGNVSDVALLARVSYRFGSPR